MVFRRFQLEGEEIIPGSVSERDRLRKEMVDWASASGVLNSASRIEREYFFKTQVGSLDPQALLDAAWRLESLGVLSWSIGLRELLPYDVQFPAADLGPLFPFGGPPPAVKAMLSSVRLRSKEEIDKQRDIAELWNWRSRTTRLINGEATLPPEFSREDLTGIVGRAAASAHESGDIPVVIGEDFPAFGKPYRDLTDDEYSIATSIAMERHYALNWLCGYERDWDKVPTGT
jgi:hypothetical protein